MRDQAMVEQLSLQTGGLRFLARTAGAGDRLILLLHGFPQTSYLWRHQIPALAARGRVVAPDLPGYGGTDPAGRGHDIATLTETVADLISALSHRPAIVVGHDWGGGIAWALAQAFPERVAALAILNAPHPRHYLDVIRRVPRQLLRSWYISFFQIRGLPEQLLTAFRARLVGAVLRATAAPGTYTNADLAVYRDALSRPGAAGAALAYYRSGMASYRWLQRHARPVECPTLVLWGTADFALDEALLDGLDRWASPLEIQRFPGVSHWLPEERPAEVNQALLAWLDRLPA